jgi:hypothetical protein
MSYVYECKISSDEVRSNLIIEQQQKVVVSDCHCCSVFGKYRVLFSVSGKQFRLRFPAILISTFRTMVTHTRQFKSTLFPIH